LSPDIKARSALNLIEGLLQVTSLSNKAPFNYLTFLEKADIHGAYYEVPSSLRRQGPPQQRGILKK